MRAGHTGVRLPLRPIPSGSDNAGSRGKVFSLIMKIVVVAAVLGETLTGCGYRQAPGGEPPNWDVMTAGRLSDLFVGGATPRFDEPGQPDYGALADALVLATGPGIDAGVGRELANPATAGDDVALSRSVLVDALRTGGGVINGSSVVGRLDDTWRVVRALEANGGLPADAAPRALDRVAELMSRVPAPTVFELLTLTRLLSSLGAATTDDQLAERSIAARVLRLREMPRRDSERGD